MGLSGTLAKKNIKFGKKAKASRTWQNEKDFYREALEDSREAAKCAGTQEFGLNSATTSKTKVEEEVQNKMASKMGESFDALAIAAEASKTRYEEQARIIATLTTSNAELAVTIKKLTNKIGISAYNPEEVYSILSLTKVDVVQIPFNIFDRRLISSGLINTLAKKKIEVQVRSIFLQGALLSKKTPSKLKKYDKTFNYWQKWCIKKKLNKVKVCLHFVKSFNKISSIIIGINDIEQLKEIIKFLKEKTIDTGYKNIIKNNNIIDPRKW